MCNMGKILWNSQDRFYRNDGLQHKKPWHYPHDLEVCLLVSNQTAGRVRLSRPHREKRRLHQHCFRYERASFTHIEHHGKSIQEQRPGKAIVKNRPAPWQQRVTDAIQFPDGVPTSPPTSIPTFP